jgi:hypothetical protein
MLACVRGRYRGETILVRACPGAERGGIAIASAARDTPAVRQLHSPRVIARDDRQRKRHRSLAFVTLW